MNPFGSAYTAIGHPRLIQSFCRTMYPTKTYTFVPLQMKECATKRNWHRAKDTKSAFFLIENARVCYNAFGEVILCKTLALKKT